MTEAQCVTLVVAASSAWMTPIASAALVMRDDVTTHATTVWRMARRLILIVEERYVPAALGGADALHLRTV